MKYATLSSWRLIRNAAIDLRFGAPLALAYLRNRDQSNADYRELESLFAGRLQPDDVLVDVGCGAGRVINQWLRMGLPGPIHGLELDIDLATRTRRRLHRRTNVSIHTGDAVEILPPDGTVFFLFNPFEQDTMQRFIAAIQALAVARSRNLTVIYLNSKHLELFSDIDGIEIEHVVPETSPGGARQPSAIITVSAPGS